MKMRVLFFLFIGLLLHCNIYRALALNNSHSPGLDTAKVVHGYLDIAYFGNRFVAVGSDGRIDWISAKGEITRAGEVKGESFSSVLVFGREIIVAGNNGTIMVLSDSALLRKVDSGTTNNIHALAMFQGKIIAGADGGEILIGDEKGTFSKTKLNLKGNIVSVSAGETVCYGATDQGEVISTANGNTWEIFDFNTFYAGYYKPCRFTKILVGSNNIALAGIHEDGSPVLMFSTRGNVWAERILNYNDDRGAQVLADAPNDIFYDAQRDLYYLACDKGKIMSIPSCSHCNKAIMLTSENLTALWGNGETLMVGGTNFYFEVLTPEQ